MRRQPAYGVQAPPDWANVGFAARVLTGLAIAAAGVAVVLVLAWVFQRRLIYFPLTESPPRASTVLPGGEDVTLETEDGLQLGAWFVPPALDGNGSAVIVFNGNAGHRAYRAELAAALARSGFAVLLFDYRGYGGNPGSPTETGLTADARAAHAYLAARADVDPARLVYFGESLGAAVALALALERPPAALVLRSPFTSLADMAGVHYPFLPAGLFLKDRYPSIDRIERLAAPLLVIAGERDRIVPPEQSRRLYQAAPEPKRLVLIPGADHNDPELLAGDRLIGALLDFLREVTEVPSDG